jgi:hypothetical protein
MEPEVFDRSAVIKELKSIYQEKLNKTLLPFLPIFNVNGKPMNLNKHYVMEPLFRINQPKRLVLMCGRQVGKSLSLAAQSILQVVITPYFHIFFIQPRFDQIKYFSSTYVARMINDCQEDILDISREQSILQKSFYNASDMYFSYAFLDAERLRGKSYIAKTVFDELADMFPDAVDIAGECMSAHEEYGFYLFSGTPRTTNNILTEKWLASSMAEWFVPCSGCSYENIPNLQNDVLKMIGKTGPICAKCGKGLDVSLGFYEHKKPKLRGAFEGFHIPQVIHPIHANNPSKWTDLIYKQNTWKAAKFQNEVLGEPCDESVCPITEGDLRAAGNKYKNIFSTAVELRKQYDAVVLGVDWSGFGAKEESTTCLALAAAKPGTDVVDILYLQRFKTNLKPEEEARQLIDMAHNFGLTYFAHDFSGAGMIREAVMTQSGFPAQQIVPFQLVFAPATKHVITFYNPPTGGRSCYNIDKTRSMQLLFEMIKRKKLMLPEWESCKELLSDFLNITQETRETPRGSEFTIMLKKSGKPDDMVFAINFAASTIWHTRGVYPSLVETLLPNSNHVTKEDLKLMDPEVARWDE